jgi:hypothetical protein
MSQWDNCELSIAIERKQRIAAMNSEASRVLVADDLPGVKKTHTVINRRTGKKNTTTFVEYMQIQQDACIKEFWLREPRSNSNGFVFRSVMSKPGNDVSDKYNKVLLSRTVVKG